MSQHDMTIADASGLAVLADVTDGLQALASTSKGGSAPTTPYAGQLWVDDNTPSTTVWTLNLYDGADWIPLGTFDTTANAFTPKGVETGVPVGSGMDFWGSTAPSGFAFAYGQELSRTTYAALFAVLGTTHGAGDGSTTFNLPDKRGRASIAKDNMGGTTAGRVTSAGSGVTGTTLGVAGGAETVTLAAGNLPSTSASLGTLAAGGTTPAGGYIALGNVDGTPSGSLTVTIGSGTPTAVNKLPPGIVCNYIIRVQ